MSNTSESNIGGLGIDRLRCEYLVDPLGIDDPAPRLSWELTSDRPGATQVAYRVCAGEWDSGKVESAATGAAYAGRPLTSRERLDWRVEVWDDEGTRSGSAPAHFEMALLAPTDWTATWIGAADDLSGEDAPTAWFRTEFTVPTNAMRARLYITALGIYEAHCNNARIGTDRFTPGWTDFHHRLQYQTYDVTDLLRVGDNALTVELA
ncbi:MAG: alpha-L-rhamnosidase, partial [Actinomycetota bacterium]